MEKRDIRLMLEDVKFSSRGVGVLRKNNKILFQKRKNDEFWALPGGAIEVLERAKDVIDGIEEGKNIVYKWIDIEDIESAKIKLEYLKKKLLDIKSEFEFIEESDL